VVFLFCALPGIAIGILGSSARRVVGAVDCSIPCNVWSLSLFSFCICLSTTLFPFPAPVQWFGWPKGVCDGWSRGALLSSRVFFQYRSHLGGIMDLDGLLIFAGSVIASYYVFTMRKCILGCKWGAAIKYGLLNVEFIFDRLLRW